MNFTVMRSPAKICWWVMANGQLLMTTETRREAYEQVATLKRTYH